MEYRRELKVLFDNITQLVRLIVYALLESFMLFVHS